MHACHRLPPPTALPPQVLALLPSPPRCWSSRSPDAPRAREGVPAESPSSQHVYHAAAEQKARSALRFALHSVPWTQKRWVSTYVGKRPNKPGREKYKFILCWYCSFLREHPEWQSVSSMAIVFISLITSCNRVLLFTNIEEKALPRCLHHR